jgi:hypothetical protein
MTLNYNFLVIEQSSRWNMNVLLFNGINEQLGIIAKRIELPENVVLDGYDNQLWKDRAKIKLRLASNGEYFRHFVAE